MTTRVRGCVGVTLVALMVWGSETGLAQGPSPSKTGPVATYVFGYKFKPGQEVRFELKHEMEISTTYNETSDQARNRSQSRRSYKVATVDAQGNAELNLTIEWVHMAASTSTNDPGVEFRSDDPEKQPAKYKHILDSIGKPNATILVNPKGRVLKVTRHEVERKPGALAPPTATGGAGPESYLYELPEKPVAVGDTWKEQFEIVSLGADGLPVKIQAQKLYQLAAVDGNLATITFKTQFLTPLNDPSVAVKLIQREPSGTLVFHMDHGIITSCDVAIDRTVIGPFGPKSSMRAVSRFTEKWLPPTTTAMK